MSFTKYRSLWFTISGVACGLALLSILVFGFRLGLDFTGGARWVVEFTGDTAPTQAEVQAFLSAQSALTQTPQVQTAEEHQMLITLQDLPDEQLQSIATAMNDALGAHEEVSYQKVDSSIGKSFQQKALWAIAAALLGIILFVAFAFRKVPKGIGSWKFGAVAIIALVHDILIVSGIFALLGYLFGIEVDLAFITALLATLGFSVNDTIVILDRVRENLRRTKGHESFDELIDQSLRQTMRRSIGTSFSTVLPLLALLIFGAGSTFYFVLALTLGITVGTYSSIFLAAPLLGWWKQWSDSRS